MARAVPARLGPSQRPARPATQRAPVRAVEMSSGRFTPFARQWYATFRTLTLGSRLFAENADHVRTCAVTAVCQPEEDCVPLADRMWARPRRQGVTFLKTAELLPSTDEPVVAVFLHASSLVSKAAIVAYLSTRYVCVRA